MTVPAEIFKQQNVFLAHCSSFQPMVAGEDTAHYSHLGRLTFAANNQVGLSCSTIKPSDSFDRRNFTGKIGLILVPPSIDAISHATAQDGGTWTPERFGDPREPKPNYTITETIVRRATDDRPDNEHNELCVIAYRVVGVFMSCPVTFNTRSGIDLFQPSHAEIYAALANQRFFLRTSVLTEVKYDPETSRFVSANKSFTHGCQ
jgi:hypothetical protein